MNIKVWDSNKKVHAKNVKSINDAFDVVRQYLHDNNFESFYFRQNLLDNKTVEVDYGSHTHFFYMQDQDGEHIFPVEQVFTSDQFDFANDPKEEKEYGSLQEMFDDFEKEMELFEDVNESIRLDVIGLNNVMKIIEALTFKQNYFTFKVTTDDYQVSAVSDPNERAYILEIIEQ